MEIKIHKPKVFISYAWGTPEYQSRVLTLSRDLQSDGIDVLLDKWSLKEGNDTYSYMEKCVNDPSVTNVLILLDPNYAEKADSRAGGVGTETQIISPEIYNHVTQDKFLPIVFERQENGQVPKPHYLKSLLHFDLSIPERYEEEYQRLVKRLYGVEIYEKPELGNTPAWVTEKDLVPRYKRAELRLLKNSNSVAARSHFVGMLNDLQNRIVVYDSETENCLVIYDELKPFKEEFLQLLKNSYNIEDANQLVGDFFQEIIWELITNHQVIFRENKRTLVHELFIYTVAFYHRTKDYKSLAYIINRSYIGDTPNPNYVVTGFRLFYCNNSALDKEKSRLDQKRYYSGTAQHWLDNITVDICGKKDFIFADLLLCNYAYYGLNYHERWKWFPITYVYGGETNTILREIAVQLRSNELSQRWALVFGYDTVNEFKTRITEVQQLISTGNLHKTSYPDSFDEAPLLGDYISPDEIATVR